MNKDLTAQYKKDSRRQFMNNTSMILSLRTSEGFCPVPLLGCDECWDQQVELPGGETPPSVKRLSISSLSVSAAALMNNLTIFKKKRMDFPHKGNFREIHVRLI